MDHYHIPKYIDQPMLFLMLPIDELLVLIIPLLAGSLFLSTPLLGLCVGVAGMYLLKKLKGEQGGSYLASMLYWFLPPIIRFQRIPPSHQRCYLG